MVTDANGAGERFWAGPPESPDQAPCGVCGEPATPAVSALLYKGGGRFSAEVTALCMKCLASQKLAHIAQRLDDPTLHPDARPYVEGAREYWEQFTIQS